MNDQKLPKAERDLLRFAFLEHLIGSRGNSLAISPVRTKGNAKLRAHVEHLRELGLVQGVRLSDAGLARGKAEQDRVDALRAAHRQAVGS